MSNGRYHLIDGSFILQLIEEYGKHLKVEDLPSKIDWRSLQRGAQRCIFYDALPIKKSLQSEEDFAAAERKKLNFLNNIRSLPNMHVRDGITRLRTKGQGKGKGEVLQQKGVDTWIAVDAMKYALFGIADELHIYTSDSDLYPVFEALQETRCRGILHYMDGRTDDALIYSADQAEEIKISHVLEWSRIGSSFPIIQLQKELCWREVCDLSHENQRFQLVMDSESRFGCNYWVAEKFLFSAEANNLYQLADWIGSHGRKTSYAEIERCATTGLGKQA